ncbi:MAG: response regulator [Myxococcales bacterium]|nr:response regulator [Myxococcales bacterium]
MANPALPDVEEEHALAAAFDAERAVVVRTRSRWIWGASLAVWVVSLLFVDRAVFTTAQALVIRLPECALACALLVWLRRPRSLDAIELAMVAGSILIAVVSGYGFAHVPVERLPVKIVSLVLSSLLVTLLGGFTWRCNLAIAVVTQLALLVVAARGAGSLWLLSLTATGFAYGVAVVSAAARDRLGRDALATRRALVRAHERLQRDDELKRRLFVDLAHDLRTPLAVIRGEAALLEGEARSKEDAASLARIERNALAVADLADQLLDLARLEAGQMPVRARPCDLSVIARDVAAQLAPRGGSRVLVEAEVPRVAQVDPGHAARILGNLVANALRQLDRAGRAGTVTLVVGGPERERVWVDVVDDGPGVPLSRREAIFERFVSFDREGGATSGVGLPLARELAGLNGGTLALLEGAPTTFRLELPATDEAPRTEPKPASSGRGVPPSSETRPPGKGRVVLVVEDDADMRRLLDRTLGRSFRVELAATVGAARQRLARAPRPSAVVTDVMLPDGTGYDVLSAVRTAFEGTPVLLLSALGEAEERVRGLTAGADDYLPKPFAPEELRSRVAAAIDRVEGFERALSAQREAVLMEVHDGVSGSLSRAFSLLSALGDGDDLDPARDAIRDGIDEVRALPGLLSPRPATLGAVAADIRRALGDACAAADLTLTLDEQGLDDEAEKAELDAAVAHALRRAAREATTNVIKYAGARSLTCRLHARPEAITLRIEDDGQGFPETTSLGQGLGIMARRALRVGGRVDHGNRDEGGAWVEITLPPRAPRPS